MPEEITEPALASRRDRPQKSRLARFLGRWTSSGRFESRSSLHNSCRMDDGNDDDLEVPRDTTGRNVLLVLVVAILTFLVTLAIMRLRQRHASPRPASSHLVVETRLATMPVAPAAATQQIPEVDPVPKAAPRPRKPQRPVSYAVVPPDHLKGEILPLSP